MCKERDGDRVWLKGEYIAVDSCLKNLIQFINYHSLGYITLAACCGHGRYKQSVIIKDNYGRITELFSGIEIPIKQKFYKKDKQGYYYLEELENECKRRDRGRTKRAKSKLRKA